ncbi:hypothetical protein [Photobacterium kishitanii]|uniref:Uncharacterized protein n=1 Tax=Photobacterium kishitanii TaxID=318456 RepID=A0A2T3KL52_9GAMM|nr:hypothetical protein [Photobacterium kishitanii]PSV00383.1 hypothetical protein C9J27_04445 [Photobacterium kishitanii]
MNITTSSKFDILWVIYSDEAQDDCTVDLQKTKNHGLEELILLMNSDDNEMAIDQIFVSGTSVVVTELEVNELKDSE